jgi:hypothetical protein
MKKFQTFVVSVAMFMAPTLAAAQGVAADRLVCGPDQTQVCTTPDAEGNGFSVLTDARARARTDCDVSQPRGVALRCVPDADVLTAEQAACTQLGEPWRWSTRHERCYQHVDPPRGGDSGSGSDGGCSGSSTCGSGVAVAVPRCTETDRTRLAAELDRIWEARTVVENFDPLQERATEVYGVLVECDDGTAESRRLIELAANMVASLDESDPASPPPPHDYHDEFDLVHDHLDRLDLEGTEAEENWCTDTDAGRFVCIALPIILGVGAIVVGGVCGAGLCEEDPGLPDHIFYQ